MENRQNKPKKGAIEHLKSRHGMTEAQFVELWLRAGGRCENKRCRAKLHSNLIPRSKSPDTTRCNIDHCHDTGFVRGLLCSLCNTTLGKLGDSVEEARLRTDALIDYLGQPHTGIRKLSKEEEIEERRKASPFGLDKDNRPYKSDLHKVMAAKRLRIAEREAWKEGRFKYLNPALNPARR